MSWYMKGQSDYESANFHMGLFFDMNGFASGDYNTIVMPDDVLEGDPFLTIAAETKPTWNPGSAVVEIGLWDDYRIKITSAGIYGWDEAGTTWVDLLAGGGDLNDLDDVVISGTPADNEVLAYNDGTSKWINQTAADAGLATSGHGHAQLHAEVHAMSIHSNEGNHVTHNYGTTTSSVCRGNDSRLSNARTPVSHNNTYHSATYITSAGALSACGMSAARVFNGTISATGGGILYLSVGSYLDIKPSTDTYGIILRDSGSEDWMNLKNVNGISYIGDGQTSTANMIAINSTTVTFPGTVAMGANKITGLGNATTGTDALNRNTADGRYYSKTEVNAFFAIGSANRRWIPLVIEGAVDFSMLKVWDTYNNTGSGTIYMTYSIPLPYVIGGTHNLVVTQFNVALKTADGSNYITRSRIFGFTDFDSTVTLINDLSNLYPGGLYPFNHADKTIGGVYKHIVWMFEGPVASADAFELSYVEAEYYYT